MATRFLHKGLNAENETGNAVPFSFDRNKQLAAKLFNAAGTIESRFVPLVGIEKVTASKAITAADHGKIFLADSTTSVVLSLPAIANAPAGTTFTLAVEQLTTSGGHAFSPSTLDQIIGNGFTPADNKDAICTAATDRLGDSITVVSDGELGWYIIAVTGTWEREG